MYRYFGGKVAVEAMTWEEYWAAAQLLSEERVGTLFRREAAKEDAAFEAVMQPEPE